MRELKALVRKLRRKDPALLPVRFYAAPPADKTCQAITYLVFHNGKPHHFVIRCTPSRPWGYMRYLVLHEWAHAVSWREGDTVDDHDAGWGVAFAALYRKYV